ncbi:UNVERIFIED_CONTAM: hypothetical protein Sangu_0158700 [Sesamum angustifolium]|uniref:Reverse transcriptase domain-containing protein n=1 Tax=Sesamum angustifolium TaxID=2727405 RepID=A0AAW2RLI3_9LAMI
MWEKLLELGRPLSMPWIILGDFNCVKSAAEKQLGVPPHLYSNSDSNPIWCKLNRVLLNNDWFEAGLHCTAHFNPLGYLSDHSPVRAKEVDLALQNAQTYLESNPRDAAVQDSLWDLKKKATFLAEVEKHFYYQKAKIQFLKAVTLAEVKTAIFQISDNKAPDPNGYTSCFFKKAWNIVGDLVCRAVMDFFRSGRMLRQLNHTIIALVPKSEHSPSVADYRPLSCCNVIYKVITKIIADRLSPALEQLIDSSQAAFVGGRNITDNIFLAQEMVWLSSTFISWIIECVSTTSFSVALNGSLHGLFTEKKGFRQGDPISSALFLLCMEYFLRLIKRNTSNSDFNFHLKCEKLKITHLLFADDLMLFSRGDLPSIHILMEYLQELRDVSGLAVNTAKSNIFTAGIQNDILDGVFATTGFARGNMPVRYLGGGVLLAQVFPLPMTVIEKIHRLCKAFLWNSKRAPVAWEEICHPKEEGSLGIRHIQSWNVALLARVLWTFIARQTPYGPSRSMRFTSGGPCFGIGSRRRATLHSFNDLPRFGTRLSQTSDLQT